LLASVYAPGAISFICETFLESDESNVVGFVLSFNDEFAKAGWRADFYVGTTLSAATKLFSINAKTDLINGYDPDDPDLQAEHSGFLTFFWSCKWFVLLDATPGARIFGFAMTNTNSYLGYPNIIARYHEATDDIQILYKSNKPYTSNSHWWHTREYDAQAGDAGTGYTNSMMYLEWSYDTYGSGKYMLPPKIVNMDSGEIADLGTRPVYYPASISSSPGSWRLGYKWPGICCIQSDSHSLPLTP